MIAVSDTSPLNYLILIQLQDLLPKLFDRVLIPEAVRRELHSLAAPEAIRRFVTTPPVWLEVHPAPDGDDELGHLDSGERAVIALAEAIRADAVLLDERKGRRIARRRGLRVSGTIAVLDRAVRAQLVEREEVIARLQASTFRATSELLRTIGSEST